jgi:hypothetical protein
VFTADIDKGWSRNIKGAHRFIADNELRIHDKDPGDTDSLALTA